MVRVRARSCALALAALLGPACGAPVSLPVASDLPAAAAAIGAPQITTVTVRVAAVGLDPPIGEHEVAIPLEQALQGLPGVTKIRSVTVADAVTLTLTLAAGAAPDEVRRGVSDRLAALRAMLPPDVLPEIAGDVAPRAQALQFVISGDLDAMRLRALAQQVREEVQRVPGVAAVELCGGRDMQLRIVVDPARLAAVAIGLDVITRSVADLVREARIGGAEELALLVIREGAAVVRLGDVARVALDGSVPACDAARIGGGAVVVGTVLPRRGVEPGELRAVVKDSIAAAQARMPAGVRLTAPELGRVALSSVAGAVPAEAVWTAARSIGASLQPSQDAFVQASVPAAAGAPVELELLVAPADRAASLTALAAAPDLRVRAQAGDVEALTRAVVAGDELETAARIADELATIARRTPVVRAAEVRWAMVPQLVVEIDRARAASLGVASDDLRGLLAAAVGGVTIGTTSQDGARIPVRLQVGESAGDPAARMAGLSLPGAGGAVPVSQVASLRAAAQPHAITRIDGRRAVEVELQFTGSTAAGLDAVQAAVERELRLPVGYVVRFE